MILLALNDIVLLWHFKIQGSTWKITYFTPSSLQLRFRWILFATQVLASWFIVLKRRFLLIEARRAGDHEFEVKAFGNQIYLVLSPRRTSKCVVPSSNRRTLSFNRPTRWKRVETSPGLGGGEREQFVERVRRRGEAVRKEEMCIMRR